MFRILAALAAALCLATTEAATVCSSSLSGTCVTSLSSCPSNYHLSYSYCGYNEYCCYPSSGGSHTTHAPAHTTHAPAHTTQSSLHYNSVCSTSLSGSCVSSISSCPSGYHLTASYCSFLHYCCYPASGSHAHHTTHAPTNAPSHTSTGSCGVSTVNQHHRIVGGTQASSGEYPWQVSLQYHGQHLCGGTLIDNQWVLTAAHCFEDTVSGYWTVVHGVNDISHVSRSHVVSAAHIYTHANYDKNTNANDIALIKLAHTVDLSGSLTRTACLPESSTSFDNMVCTVTGWGAIHSDSGAVRYLREVDVPIMTNSVCSYYLGRGKVHTHNICAGYDHGGKDSCQGDSGGPLVCQKNGVWTLAGVVSWGYGCAESYSPGVYTRVSSFLSWIHTVRSQH